MYHSDVFFQADAPVVVEKVFFFLALDYGGGSSNNYATSVTSSTGETLGEVWVNICDGLDAEVTIAPATAQPEQPLNGGEIEHFLEWEAHLCCMTLTECERTG